MNKDEENKIQKIIKEEIAKTDNQKKRMKEVERIGYNYQRRDYTREELIEKYGQDWIDMVDESTSDGWLKMFNDYKHSYYVENFDKIPMGLEKKVALGWFMHFFNWNDMDAFQARALSRETGHDCPGPYFFHRHSDPPLTLFFHMFKFPELVTRPMYRARRD